MLRKPPQAELIAVLMTCHDRREATLRCLRALYDQELPGGVNFETYLVDDGCTDGTGDAVREQFPDVNVIQGDGNLYWCGGMRVAWAEAMKNDYDAYLWLNDDTTLLPGAFDALLATADEVRNREGHACIVVGSTQDPVTGERTYGGLVRANRWTPLATRFVEPSDRPQPCDTMNGNCVLVSRPVAQLVGNFSPEFTHARGDVDYGLRAKAMGVPIWTAPEYVGECPRNSPPDWVSPNVPLKKRLKNLRDPKGLPPREWLVFTRRHTGIRWPYYWAKLYLRLLFPRLWGMLK